MHTPDETYTPYTLGISEARSVVAPALALIAHDRCKAALVAWARAHDEKLRRFTLYATGTTGSLLRQETGLTVRRLLSGSHGGDAQIGALIAERRVRGGIFFWDPLTPQSRTSPT